MSKITEDSYEKSKKGYKLIFLGLILERYLGKGFYVYHQENDYFISYENYAKKKKLLNLGLSPNTKSLKILGIKVQPNTIEISPKKLKRIGYRIAKENLEITEKVLEGFGKSNIRSYNSFLNESNKVLKGIQKTNKRYDNKEINQKEFIGEIDAHEDYMSEISTKKELLNRIIPDWKDKPKKFAPKKRGYHHFLEYVESEG